MRIVITINNMFKRIFIVLILLLLSFHSFPQSKKKDVGVSEFFGTGLDTDKIVDKLVEAESKKGEKYQQEVSNQIIMKAIINFVEYNLKELKDIAKSMYDYRSPFQNRIGFSSDEELVKVIPNRGADVGENKIKVEKMAKADVFVSDLVPVGYELKPFKVVISLGEKSAEIDFKGGTLRDLSKLINDVAKDIVTSSVIKVNDNSEVIRIEGRKTGKNAKVYITGDISELVAIGLLSKRKEVVSQKLNILSLFTSGDSITVREREEFSKNTYYKITKNSIIEISNVVSIYSVPKPREVDIRIMDSVKISNVEVKGGTPITTFDVLNEYVSNDFVFLVIRFKDGVKEGIVVTNTYLKLNLSFYEGKEIDEVIIRNMNDVVKVTFYRIIVYDKSEEIEADYVPKNYLSRADDAVIYINGVKVERDQNDIFDVINGTIRVVGENPNKEVVTKVDYDYNSITNFISNFIAKYNDVMIYLSKITKPIVDRRQLYEKPDEEKEEGAFANDLDMSRLKDKLRMFAMGVYKTRSTNVRLLYHVGIYTKSISAKLDFESDLWEYVRRGVLTIDNEKLLQMISENIFVVNDIFGYDSDGDKIIDTGFAYSVSTLCDEYTRVNGVIANKKKQIDSVIKSNKEMYAKFQDRLEEYRLSLERKFGKLQQVLRESKSKQDWFNNQMKAVSSKD
ncbi:MAG: flagellar filament capping protein FliD [Brevinematia bacterium]